MLFRGSQKKTIRNKYSISLPGNKSTCRSAAPRRFGNDFLGRAAFCISDVWKNGSMCVEAAFALPLFFLTVVSLISLMGIYGSFAAAMVQLQEKAEEQALLQIYRSGESDVPIRLSKTVEEPMLLLPFSAGTVKAKAVSSVLPWTGRSEYSSLQEMQAGEGRLYYVSDHRSVYHTSSSCSYLSLRILAVEADRIASEENNHGRGYDGCEKCVGAGAAGTVVYVTSEGEHFHNSAECSGLKRSVHLAEEEEIEGLSLCTRCGKREGIHGS